jgi:FdrA protein
VVSVVIPVIGCFLGLGDRLRGVGAHFHQALTIDEAVQLALHYGPGGNRWDDKGAPVGQETIRLEVASWRSEQRYLRGLFAGGTFCYQTQQVLCDAGLPVYSNAPLDKRYRLENPEVSLDHSVIDLGEDYFTLGKPHPMIDATERRKRILAEAEDPEVANLLLDFILGNIASPDPVGDFRRGDRRPARWLPDGRGLRLRDGSGCTRIGKAAEDAGRRRRFGLLK